MIRKSQGLYPMSPEQDTRGCPHADERGEQPQELALRRHSGQSLCFAGEIAATDSIKPTFSAAKIAGGPNISFKLLLLFLVLLYSNAAIVFSVLDAIRPAQIVAMIAIAFMIVEAVASGKSIRLMWPQSYMFIAFLGVAIISSLDAIYLRQAYDTTSDLWKYLVIYLLLENTITTESRARSVMFTLVLAGIFPAAGTISHYIEGARVEGRAAWVGIFANPNEVAYALSMLIPIAAALGRHSRRAIRMALWGLIGLYALTIFLTFSRGGMLGLCAVLGLMGWKQRSTILRVLMIGGLAASIILAAAFWERNVSFTDISADTTFNQRIATIKAGLLMFADKPLFGVGPGCSLVAYPLYVPKEAHCGCQEQLVVHNSFVQVLGELGAIGFIPWIVFLGASIFHAWRLHRKGTTLGSYAQALEIALWGYVVCSLSGGYTYTWFPYLLAGVVAALTHIGTPTRKGLSEVA